MDEDCIRLTSYFSERQRANGRPLADALTGLYASREVAASIVLRGTGGSSAAIAVGPRPDIEALLGQAVRLASPGLVTIERARLLTGDIEPTWLGEQPGEATMLAVHCRRQDCVYQVPAFEVVCELLYRRGIAGATVLPGADGSLRGRRQHPQRPHFLRHDADAPLMVIAVGSGNEIGMALPELGMLFRHPVMTVEKVRVCQRDGQFVGRPQLLPGDELEGITARLKLTVYTSEAAWHEGQPVHRAVARQLSLAGAESVTVTGGIWGFHADHPPHGDRFPHRGRHVPVITTGTGTPERISAAFDAISALTAERGLVTVQSVLAVQPAAGSAQRSG